MKRIYLWLLAMIACNLLSAQCYQDRHSTIASDAWVSCQVTENPNSDRGPSHWIMYDFGQPYTLGQMQLWNMNAYDRTNEGINEAVLDYSTDGVNWSEWGAFNLSEATASSYYEGEEGPDLGFLKAQYIIITAISNHGGECYGLAELKIETEGVTTNTEDLVALGIDQLLLYPNPADMRSNLSVQAEYKISGMLQITDVTGRVISEEVITIDAGDNTYEINTSQLNSGQYNVHIISGPFNASAHLSVVHPN